MTLKEIKKLFRYGWIAKNENECWHWFSKEPELLYDDDNMLYYWFGEESIEIGIIDGIEGLASFASIDSLIEIGLDCQNKVMVEQGVIKIDDLIPLLRHGYVFMDKTGDWYWSETKPKTIGLRSGEKFWDNDFCGTNLSIAFDIESIEDWKKSLIKVGE